MKTDDLELYTNIVVRTIYESFPEFTRKIAGITRAGIEDMITSSIAEKEDGRRFLSSELFRENMIDFYEDDKDTDEAIAYLKPICHKLVNAQLNAM